jgi:membrane-associated phospholipid phosphatase
MKKINKNSRQLLIASLSLLMLFFWGIWFDWTNQASINLINGEFAQSLSTAYNPIASFIFSLIDFYSNFIVILVISLLAGFVFYKQAAYQYIYGLILSLFGTEAFLLLSHGILIRPDFSHPVILNQSQAISDGHTALMVVLSGFMAYYLGSRYQPTRPFKALMIVLAVVLIILTAAAQLYFSLGSLSSVLIGFLVGFLWLIIGVSEVESR